MPRTYSTRQAARGLQQQQQPGIQSFARATKPGVVAPSSLSDIKKPATTTTTNVPVTPSKKRKLVELENVDCRGPQGTESTDAVTPSKSLRLGELTLNTPRSGHYARSSVSVRRSGSAATAVPEQPPSTPSKRTGARKITTKPAPVNRRAACVEDLVNLHGAFLKAVALHAMHNGVTAPADLRELLPTIERLWKKRKVVIKDLQRLIWILNQEPSSTAFPGYRIANYGLGRVCLERIVREGEERTSESELQERFEQSVDLLWEKALDAVDGDESRVDFVNTLGVATIQESLTPFTTFRKGQQRLQDLRGGVIRLKTEKLRADGKEDVPEKPIDAASTRRKGLLERIKDKQMRQATLPPPPSKQELLRRAAAERVEEVAGVLALLRPAGYVGTGAKAVMAAQRTPFRIEMIAQHVRDSVRSPISQQEVEICLEILAREDVAGGWVNLVTVNQMKSVVLKSCADVQPKEIGVKVAQLKLGWEGSEAQKTVVSAA